MKQKKIQLRTHGGLGNQLFQIFYALLNKNHSGAEDLLIYHDSRYKHGFKLSKNIKKIHIDQGISNAPFLLRYKFIKILEKFRVNEGKLSTKYDLLLDGYFHDIELYVQFPQDVLIKTLSEIKSFFYINRIKAREKLYHFRLGDFFENEEKKNSFALQYINNIEYGAHIITNEIEVLKQPSIYEVLIKKK